MTVPIGVDVDALILDILTPANTSDGPDAVTARVVEIMPADYVNKLPIVRAHCWAGTSTADPRFLESAVLDVDVYDDDRTAAFKRAFLCRGALFDAWQRQLEFEHGSIASYAEQARPSELRTGTEPDGLTVVHATYRLGVSPRFTP